MVGVAGSSPVASTKQPRATRGLEANPKGLAFLFVETLCKRFQNGNFSSALTRSNSMRFGSCPA